MAGLIPNEGETVLLTQLLARISNDRDADLELALFTTANPVETITDIAQLTRSDFAVGDGRSITVAPYFINQASFSDKFQLFLGGRFDVIDYEDDRVDFNPENPFGPIPSTTSRNYEKFSPMAGMVYSPVPTLSFYANAGQAFRAPSTLTSGEPKAEESTQYEVGAKLKTLGGRLSSTVSVYNLERENIAIPDQTGVTRQTGRAASRSGADPRRM